MIKRKRFLWLSLILFCSLLPLSCNFIPQRVDLIVHNAAIYSLDDQFTVYEAMAIADGRIVALGAEREIMNKYTAPKLVDAGKRPVYPGWHDAHAHMLVHGLSSNEIDLSQADSWSEVVSMVSQHASNHTNMWIVGRGWDHEKYPDLLRSNGLHSFPSREILDSLFPDRPVVLMRSDGHTALANGKALNLAEINSTSKIKGGEIELRNNQCTGILLDEATYKVLNTIPEPTRQDKINAWIAAQKKCFENGILSVTEAGLKIGDILLLDSLFRSGNLQLKIQAMIADDDSTIAYFTKNGPISNDHLQVRSLKLYADGSLGSRGACLLRPYSDLLQQGQISYGKMVQDTMHLLDRLYWCKNNHFQACTHAIGDSAVRTMLRLYSQVLDEEKDARWRIEHAQIVNEQDLVFFDQYNIIPSVQPEHAISDRPWVESRIGKERLADAYRLRSLKERMGIVAFGTDFPFDQISPWRTFSSAALRKDTNNDQIDSQRQKEALSAEDALRAMTLWPAIAAFVEDKTGSLEQGKDADFIVLDEDILHQTDTESQGYEILQVFSSGKEVWRKR